MKPRVKNWRACAGVNKHTGRVKRGFRAVRGQCPTPKLRHATTSTTTIDLVSTAAVFPGLGRARKPKPRTRR